MELLKAYLKERRLTLAAFLLFVGVFAVSFALYGLPLAAVGYPAGLCVLLGACLAAWDYGRAARRQTRPRAPSAARYTPARRART